jgi:hypothetical protein
MQPLGFIAGIAVFGAAVKNKKMIRKLVLNTAVQVLSAVERLKTAGYLFKEELEDIIAEAHYENMKKSRSPDEHEAIKEEASEDTAGQNGKGGDDINGGSC